MQNFFYNNSVHFISQSFQLGSVEQVELEEEEKSEEEERRIEV